MDIDNDKLFRRQTWLMVRTCLLGVVAIAGLYFVATIFDGVPEESPAGRTAIAAVGLIASFPIVMWIGIRCEPYLPKGLARFVWCWSLPIAYVAFMAFVVRLVYQ
jgi:FtsH-binding integral membrane protein